MLVPDTVARKVPAPLPSLTMSIDCDPSELHLSRVPLFGGQLVVVRVRDEPYLIGTEMAALLRCESFNLYSTARRFHVPIYRAETRLIKLLLHHGVISTSTKSVSLLSFSESSEFLKDRLARLEAKKRRQRDAVTDRRWEDKRRRATPQTKAKRTQPSLPLEEAPEIARLLGAAPPDGLDSLLEAANEVESAKKTRRRRPSTAKGRGAWDDDGAAQYDDDDDDGANDHEDGAAVYRSDEDGRALHDDDDNNDDDGDGDYEARGGTRPAKVRRTRPGKARPQPPQLVVQGSAGRGPAPAPAPAPATEAEAQAELVGRLVVSDTSAFERK